MVRVYARTGAAEKLLEAADHLSISRTAAYEIITTGQLKAKRFGKKNIRVHVDELERYERKSDWRAGE